MNEKLMNYVEIEAEKAENLSFCRGLKLLHVRDQVEEILSNIGKLGIFEEYTKAFDIDSLSAERIYTSKTLVCQKYKYLGGNSRVASLKL